jgi:hypothetical protein
MHSHYLERSRLTNATSYKYMNKSNKQPPLSNSIFSSTARNDTPTPTSKTISDLFKKDLPTLQLFDKDLPTLQNMMTQPAPRIVKMKKKPKNGRSSLPKGIVKHDQNGSVEEAPETSHTILTDPFPRDVSITDMSKFLAADKISWSPIETSKKEQTLKEFLQCSRIPPKNSHSPSVILTRVSRILHIGEMSSSFTTMTRRTPVQNAQRMSISQIDIPSYGLEIPAFTTSAGSTHGPMIHPSIHPPFELPCNEAPPIRYLEFLVGTQDPNSRYKTQRLFRVRASLIKDSKVLSKYKSYAPSLLGNEHDPVYHLPDVDSQAFDLYLSYQPIGPYSQSPAKPKEKASWQEYWPLMNAHILATTIEDAGFADFIIDELAGKFDSERGADNDTIKRVFNALGISPELRQLLVDHGMSKVDELLAHGLQDLPMNLLNIIPHVALRIGNVGDAPQSEGCKYHTHGLNAECYKRRISMEKTPLEADKSLTQEDPSDAENGAQQNCITDHCDPNGQNWPTPTISSVNGETSKPISPRLTNRNVVQHGLNVNRRMGDDIQHIETNDEVISAADGWAIRSDEEKLTCKDTIGYLNELGDPDPIFFNSEDEGRELAPKTGVHPPDNGTSALDMTTSGDLAEECPKNDLDSISTCLHTRLEGLDNDVPFGVSKAEAKRIVQSAKCPGSYPESVSSFY